MEKIKKKCVENLRRQAQKAGINMDRISDDEIWTIWWKKFEKDKR